MSSTYQPGYIPDKYEPNIFRGEFAGIKRGMEDAAPFLELQTLHAVPKRLRAGMVVLADGTDWDPGAGAGFYGYYGAAWHKLG